MFLRRFCTIFALFLSAISAHATVGDRFGFTSEDAALAGASAGRSEISSASAFNNPAQLSLLSDSSPLDSSSIRFHWSVLYSAPKFAEIGNVVVENPVNSDLNDGDTPRSASVNADYPVTFGQSLGFAIRSKKSEHHWGLGAVAYLPLDRLALLDSGEPLAPEYTLHRGRTQKPEFQLGFSGLITPKLSLGLGLYLGARLTSDTTVFLNQGTGTVSTMRVAASLKTQATPSLGFTYVPSDALSLGLVLRLASSAPETLNVQAGARAIGNVSALDFSFPAMATMYYDPLTLTAGTRWRYTERSALAFQLDYQAWSKFESPSIVILDPNTQTCSPSCGVDFSTGRGFGRTTRDTFIPRVGHLWTFGPSTLRAGYAYRPSIYRDDATGAGNAIDPDEHRFSMGYGWEIAEIPIFDAPGRVDIHAAYSVYPKRRVTKSVGDENGNLLNSKIGSPGYETGGSEWGTGFTLGFFL